LAAAVASVFGCLGPVKPKYQQLQKSDYFVSIRLKKEENTVLIFAVIIIISFYLFILFHRSVSAATAWP
jgi:hypothetical protein